MTTSHLTVGLLNTWTRSVTVILFVVVSLSGCNTTPSASSPPETRTTINQESLSQPRPLNQFYEKWRGVPYRWGGTTPTGVDCSALVQIAYEKTWQVALPRTTKQQSLVGKRIAPSHARYGDLVFFHITKNEKHVGLYLGKQRFIHASSSKGVMISRLNNPYWAARFWQFRHINK
ncbi:C40 family peptidase [Vibrio zhugei]|uniref:C40 family peptidase n=1 Tax=Vibrio zhugei TaxID=2479546 RepID=A0ABV7C7H2_9VIBR|nr:NlpC/P60 family protein [Vibrio zhugei]